MNYPGAPGAGVWPEDQVMCFRGVCALACRNFAFIHLSGYI